MRTGDDVLNTLEAWEENVQCFRGTVLDDAKIERLNKMKEKAAEIVKLTNGHLRRVPFPYTNHDKSASVLLRGENPILMMDTRIAKLVGELCGLADMLSIAIVENTEEIQMCFMVWNIWKEWRTENSPFTKNEKEEHPHGSNK